eukprot:m.11161 g.11161  ORF g.11161 m.11161 type:complete len:75 (+) comp5678_c0_seq1:138-362(+)
MIVRFVTLHSPLAVNVWMDGCLRQTEGRHFMHCGCVECIVCVCGSKGLSKHFGWLLVSLLSTTTQTTTQLSIAC